MKSMAMKIALALTLATLLTSCAAQNERQMYAAASALTKLSSTVEATVMYKDPSPTLSDDELLKLSTANDPGLLQTFDGYKLRVQKGSQAVIVLVCKADASTALLEDASCTAKLDRHHWRDSASTACEFTLTVAEVCAP